MTPPKSRMWSSIAKVGIATTMLCFAGIQPAHASYYTLSATNSVTAYANGWIYLSFVNAVNEANTRVSSPSRAGYAYGSVYNGTKTASVQNPSTTSTSWVYTSRSAYYGTRSVTDWTNGRVCVVVPYWFPTCTNAYGQIV